MIRQIESHEIEICIQVIRKSFATVAHEFNLTQENFPEHTSFIKAEKLYKQFEEGKLMYVYLDNGTIIGYFSLAINEDGGYELNNLAVLPEYRHKGYGKDTVTFAIDKVRELGSNKMTIGIIEENEKLKKWYSNLGFIHTGTRKSKNLPFTIDFMEIEIK